MNKKLIVIEGFDRSGKDTLMKDIYDNFNNENTYVYFSELEGLPKYDKEENKFLDWLNKFINKQIQDINNLFKTYDIVIMCRLLISDEVYSTLFNREHTTIKYIDNLKNVDIYNYCLLFKNYEEYKNRLKKLGDDFIQYNLEDFNRINQLYVEQLEKFNHKYFINYIFSDDSRQLVLENFINKYNIISND